MRAFPGGYAGGSVSTGRAARRDSVAFIQPPTRPRCSPHELHIWANRGGRAARGREAIIRPHRATTFAGKEVFVGRLCVTPRQTCPRPSGFGRNLRSKTRWFTGFCNSHQVSHFATFFIDARAEISVAESRVDLARGIAPRRRTARADRAGAGRIAVFLDAVGAVGSVAARGPRLPRARALGGQG